MADQPNLFSDVARWYAATTLALGLRTGLTQALLDAPGTADDLATRSSTDPANAARWADAMVAAGYATLDAGTYVPVEDVLGLLRGGAPIGVGPVVELLGPLGGLLPRVERAMRDGGGISSDELQAAFGPLPELVNAPMYEALLVGEWIAGHPVLESALRDGIDVAEIGPGGGTALRLLGAAYPASRFTGFELDQRQVALATAAAATNGLANVRFEARDGAELGRSTFDLVLILDALHHVTSPGRLIDAVRAALRPGGSLLIAEASLSGNPAIDAADPTAIIVYGSDLLYCFQESKTAESDGLGATWAGRELDAFLRAHGFDPVGRVDSTMGYAVVRAVVR